MRKFVNKAIFFLLFFIGLSVLINSLYLLLITKTDWNFAKRIESIRWEDPDFELLALGTSLGDYGLDAELLTKEGIKSFNLALVGGSIQTSYVQLKEYLEKYEQDPRYVLLFVNAHLEEFNQDGIQPLVEFTMKGQKIDLKDVPISKFQWQTHELFKKALSPSYRSGYTSYGQTRRNSVTPDMSEYQDLEFDLEKYQSAIWIGEMATLCNERGIEFIVIDIPGIRETQNISEIGPYDLRLDNGQKAVLYNLNSREFCKFIDTEKDWSGMSHFNEYGAAKFTTELLKILRENHEPNT
jgi:hypothetical protein